MRRVVVMCAMVAGLGLVPAESAWACGFMDHACGRCGPPRCSTCVLATCQPVTCMPKTCQPVTCKPKTCQPATCMPKTCRPVTCVPTTCQPAVRAAVRGGEASDVQKPVPTKGLPRLR